MKRVYFSLNLIHQWVIIQWKISLIFKLNVAWNTNYDILRTQKYYKYIVTYYLTYMLLSDINIVSQNF